MGELIVVAGPPGAGKSSVSAVLADMFVPSALVAGDSFFAFLRRGYIPPWQSAADQQNLVVTEAAAGAAGRLCGHCWVVYDGRSTRASPAVRWSTGPAECAAGAAFGRRVGPARSPAVRQNATRPPSCMR